MTNSLQKIQQDLQAYLLEGKQDIFKSVIADAKSSGQSRLQVYQDAYYARLTEILGNDYIIIKKMLGDAEFEKLAHSYIKASPATNPSIRCYGSHLSDYLLHVAGYAPMYAEMARFEWSLGETFDAPDKDAISFNDILQIANESWGYLQFIPHPAVKLETFLYNTVEIWSANQNNNPEISVNLMKTPTTYLIWRRGFDFAFVELNPPQADMLQHIFAGKTFGDICESLCQWLPEEEVVQFAGGNLRTWVEEGLFTALNVLDSSALDQSSEL